MSGASNRSMSLNPEEKRLYGQLFKQCDPENLGIVTGEVARTLFERSGLSPAVLGEIWQLADMDNQGFLNQVGFSTALRVIGHVQNGTPVSNSLGDYPGPLPKFDGQPRPDNNNNTVNTTAGNAPPIVAPAPVSASAVNARVPTLNTTDRARFVGLFDKSAPSGLLDGESAKNIFLKARLPNETLGQIWNLADTEGRGSLNQAEFVVAMHLIQCTLNGSMKQFPDALPPGLFDAASGRPSSRASQQQRVSSASSQRPLQQPVAQQYTGGSIGSGHRQPLGPASAEWQITPKERARFDSIFNNLDQQKKGSIGASEVVPFLTTSKLSEEVLAQVWDLADVNNTGEFTKNEFSIAMYLVQQKLAGRDLPPVLPQSLLYGGVPGASRQSSVSSAQPPVPSSASSFAAQQQQQAASSSPNPVFFSGGQQPQRSGSTSQAPPQLPSPVEKNNSSMNDLASLNDLFSSPAPGQSSSFSKQQAESSGSAPPSGTASSGAANNTVPPESPRTQQELKQFVPTSSFGQTIAQQDTGAARSQSPQVTGAQAATAAAVASGSGPGAASNSNRDLLAENSEASKSLSAATTELGNLSNQISSLTTQTVGLTDKREKSEAELANVLAKKKDIETKLTTLRSNYDQEVRKVKEVEQMLEQARQETAKVSQDYSVLEASYHALQSQLQEASTKLANSQQENSALKEKIQTTNSQIATLKENLETAQREAKQQQGMVSVNQKQLATSEQEKESLEGQIQNLHLSSSSSTGGGGAIGAAAAAGAAAVAGAAGGAALTHKDGEKDGKVEEEGASVSVPVPQQQQQQQQQPDSEQDGDQIARPPSGNPFFAGNNNFAPPPTDGQGFDSASDRQKAFEETFSRMEVTSPSTAEVARSSTHNTLDTPNSSPPASDFQYNNAEGSQGTGFTLPIARPESATSSVQNNPPQSVRGELDVSRPESPDETSEPVSGIVPPENFPEIKGPGEQSAADSLPVQSQQVQEKEAVDPLRHGSLATLTPKDEPKSEDRNSSDSYEIVNAENSGSEKEEQENVKDPAATVAESTGIPSTAGLTSIPGGFPVPDAASSETSTKDWAENQKNASEFPPMHEVEQFEDSSSDEEGPEDIVKNKKPLDSNALEGASTSSVAGEHGGSTLDDGTSASIAPGAASTTSTADRDFTSAPSSPTAVSAAPASTVPAQQSNVNESQAPTPRPEESDGQKRNVTDPFASAFSGLSEAQEENAASSDFQFNDSFEDFQTTFDSAFHTELNGAPGQQHPFPPTATAGGGSNVPANAPTTNDEWEQLFAGFSNSNAPTESDVNDAFKVSSSSQQSLPLPPPVAPQEQQRLTPHSQAVQDLTGMGFSHEDALDALKKNNYSLAEASNYLLDKK